MVLSKEIKFLKCFTLGKTDQSQVNKIQCCMDESFQRVCRSYLHIMSISGFGKSNTNIIRLTVKRQSQAIHCEGSSYFK